MFNQLMEFFTGRSMDAEDFNLSGEISADAFRAKVDEPRFRCYLSAHGIDIKNVKTFFSMLAKEKGQKGAAAEAVDIQRLAHACVRMKGFATSLEMQSLSYETRSCLGMIDMTRKIR